MLATQMPDVQLEAKDVKDIKQIKEKLAAALKALQKRYVTSDAVVTSEDGDANLLCCALEAVFIHGIKAKYVRSQAAAAAGRDRRPLPQPFFWSLLKAVTHRDVVLELERLSFVSTEVGRCRAWLRLALNHGLLECYLVSLFREEAPLRAHYRPGALLLHAEERDVLLSYLQGLASLTFSLSYKSAVLNQWTTTPLVLAGLQEGEPEAPTPAPAPTPTPAPRESWDTASQSSGSSDAAEAQRDCCPLLVSRGPGAKGRLTSSSLSLDTCGSSQLSSSLGSDGPPQGPAPDLAPPTTASKAARKDSLGRLQESSQDSLQDDSFVSSAGPDQFSDTNLFSGSDSDTQPPPTPSWDQERPLQSSSSSSSSQDDDQPGDSPPALVSAPSGSDGLHPALEPEDEKEEACPREEAPPPSTLSRKLSSDSLLNARSWISEDDIYKPRPVEEEDDRQQEEAPPPAAAAEPQASQSPPSVVHRRQIGLSNPFRGLLKLGHLERRGAVGLWRDCYCELSPFEFRLYADAEERACCDNCSLLRCEDARIASPDGRFDLTFPGKRLALRAASRGEAEDWLDRILEAVARCRPAAPQQDDQWEVLQPLGESGADPADSEAPPPAPPSPPPPPPPPAELDWSLAAAVEPDALKEAVLYVCGDPEGCGWSPLVFSLSLEAVSSFRLEGGRKLRRHHIPVQQVRDVVPDVCAGGPAAFKLLTVGETLRLRAESAQEARSWRALIRGALDSYLDQDQGQEPAGSVGNLQRLVQHRLGEDGALLAHLDLVPAEKGLDAQGFRCAGCPQKVGPSLAPARLCHFSGLHYCLSCHRGDASVIPSRVVHNWDLTQRPVSRKALKLLSQVEQEPLLDLQQLNPELLQHAEPMAHTNHLRHRLRLLGDYLLTCRSGACKKLQARMEQRTYLLESTHLYSVADLRQIAEDQYATYLTTLIQFASNHVFHCDLCTQRGFICQVCHADDIIFPFQLDRTTRCQDCKAVFHLSCKSPEDSCPRCQRIRKYLERDLQD